MRPLKVLPHVTWTPSRCIDTEAKRWLWSQHNNDRAEVERFILKKLRAVRVPRRRAKRSFAKDRGVAYLTQPDARPRFRYRLRVAYTSQEGALVAYDEGFHSETQALNRIHELATSSARYAWVERRNDGLIGAYQRATHGKDTYLARCNVLPYKVLTVANRDFAGITLRFTDYEPEHPSNDDHRRWVWSAEFPSKFKFYGVGDNDPTPYLRRAKVNQDAKAAYNLARRFYTIRVVVLPSQAKPFTGPGAHLQYKLL